MTVTTLAAEGAIATRIRSYKPLGDNLIILVDEPPERSQGGIALPEATRERPARGCVVCTGPGVHSPSLGERLPMSVRAGDRVLFDPYAGTEIDDSVWEGRSVRVLREGSVLAVLTSQPPAAP